MVWPRKTSCLSVEVHGEAVLSGGVPSRRIHISPPHTPPTFPLGILVPNFAFQALSQQALLGVRGCSHQAEKFHPYVSDSFTLIKM